MNVFYHLVWNIWCSHLILKNVEAKKRPIILSIVLYACETWSSH